MAVDTGSVPVSLITGESSTHRGDDGNGFELSSLVGPTLIRKDGTRIGSNTVVVDVIGIYFSAHW